MLREIRKKLRTTEKIHKITQAMEMVAASRLKKAQERVEKSRIYATRLKEILEIVIRSSSPEVHPLMRPRVVKRKILVIISGDRGLCGGYHTLLFHTADRFLRQTENQNSSLVLVGRKAVDYYNAKKWDIKWHMPGWSEKSSEESFKTLSVDLIRAFLSGECDEVLLLYTHFTGALSREIVMEKFLNIAPSLLEKNLPKFHLFFEPTQEQVYEDLLPRYCTSRMHIALLEAYASELAARTFAMRTAAKNAEEMIGRLTHVRNKVRQMSITREVIEIISGAEGIK
jgi:F-type H+-transporting ATPase subunit gamma